jgi:DNA-binding transcriptional ArsR family regulator
VSTSAEPPVTDGEDPGAVVLTDARAIKALAHPARLAVIDRLFGGEVLTATECATIAGLTPSAMSYHLRALQRWGLIAPAGGSGDGRERPWKALGTSVQIRSESSRAASAASGVLLGQLMDTMRSEVLHNAELRGREDPSARPAGFSFSHAMMTDAEARELFDRIEALTRTYAERPDPPPGARRHHLWWAGLPVDGEPPPATTGVAAEVGVPPPATG